MTTHVYTEYLVSSFSEVFGSYRHELLVGAIPVDNKDDGTAFAVSWRPSIRLEVDFFAGLSLHRQVKNILLWPSESFPVMTFERRH